MRQFLTLLLLSAATPAIGQVSATAPVAQAVEARPWYRPNHVQVQTAGGMGLIAAGVGYTTLRDRLEADILVGYVPEKHAGSTLSIATAKLLYTPYTVPLSDKFVLRPLTIGIYGSYTHGTINDEVKGQYTKGYYWFSTDTRIGPLLGGRLSYLRPTATPTDRQRRISAYYELGSNDLYLVSLFSNANRKSLSPADVLTLGLGLKMDF
ncbi:hypothetical protein [Hymenobacter sp. YC55]|uniref:hypothetical protein n=1 Tax=Hymenobacter sp. YC55 TaxID=3034019 RepID=UPI0023F907B6|nr:hypothetical protein [Hymenobacter sp. YC55]MDF7812498.1 hypothetical protein [Hymenobacter sp. YC55]